MSSRIRLTATGIAAAAFAAALTGCGGSTVEGAAPEVSSGTAEASSSSAGSGTTFAQERPEKPTAPVSPPPSSPAPGNTSDPGAEHDEPEAGEPGAGEPAPRPEPAPPASMPGAGDFSGLLGQQGVVLPEGMDPVATATEACGRFDNGQQMVDVSGWLGEHAQLNPEHQGFFLGAAVGTYCPQNFPKLG